MNEVAVRDDNAPDTYREDPTGGRLVAWAQAASAANQLAQALTSTTFVPAHFKGNVGDATAAILMGDELGLSPLAAFRSIYVVHGTPALYARGMVALALSQGHEVWTEKSTDAEVTVKGRRKGSQQVETSTWTIKRAATAGYTSNKKYQTNPQEMLYSKAAAEICRKVAADALAGVPYSVEDLELEDASPTTKVTRSVSSTKVGRAKPVVTVSNPQDDTTPSEPLNEPEPTGEGMTPDQQKKMFAQFGELGIKERDEYQSYISQVIGHEVESSKDLTVEQASAVIEAQIADLEAMETVDGELPIGGDAA
jgi:hypothetical protein